MIADLFASNVVEVVSEDVDADTQSGKLVLRVHDEKQWIRMMQALLIAANTDGAFGLEAHKVFHKAEGDVQYTWVLILWGDPTDVREPLRAVLAKNIPKPPPFALGRSAPASAPRITAQPATRVAEPPATAVLDYDGPPQQELVMPGLRDNGRHNIKLVEEIHNGAIETRTTVKLAHQRTEMFGGRRNPHEVIDLHSGRGKFKAVVQGRGESEFSYRRDGGGGSL